MFRGLEPSKSTPSEHVIAQPPKLNPRPQTELHRPHLRFFPNRAAALHQLRGQTAQGVGLVLGGPQRQQQDPGLHSRLATRDASRSSIGSYLPEDGQRNDRCASPKPSAGGQRVQRRPGTWIYAPGSPVASLSNCAGRGAGLLFMQLCSFTMRWRRTTFEPLKCSFGQRHTRKLHGYQMWSSKPPQQFQKG